MNAIRSVLVPAAMLLSGLVPAHAEPLYFTSGNVVYRADSETRAYSIFTQGVSVYGRFSDAVCDTAGNLIVATSGGAVVRIDENGVSTLLAEVSDSQLERIDCFGTSEFAVTSYGSGVISRVTPTGAVTTWATLFAPVKGLSYDPFGGLYAHTGNSLYYVTRTGSVSFIRDWAGYPLKDLARLPDGNLIACGASEPVIIAIDPAVAVTSPQPYSGRNGIGSSLYPYAISVNQNGIPAYLQGYSPFNSGSILMFDGNWITGGAGFVMDTVAFKVTAVPEPSTYTMALAGLGFIGYSMWRRRMRI
jgi:hypothetical protein